MYSKNAMYIGEPKRSASGYFTSSANPTAPDKKSTKLFIVLICITPFSSDSYPKYVYGCIQRGYRDAEEGITNESLDTTLHVERYSFFQQAKICNLRQEEKDVGRNEAYHYAILLIWVKLHDCRPLHVNERVGILPPTPIFKDNDIITQLKKNDTDLDFFFL